MKSFFAIFFLLYSLSNVLLANDRWSMNPAILQDTLNENIPSGKIKFKGTVVNNFGETIMNSNILASNSTIQKINWDNSGAFEILVDTSFTTITFTAEGYVSLQLGKMNFQNQHEITLKVTLYYNQISPVDIKPDQIMTFKPVIYLYGDDLEEISVKLKPSGDFTFTYPQIINEQWNVSLKNNEIIHKGKALPYLFYETENDDMNFHNKESQLFGHIAQKNDVIEYLESSLTQMGLTTKEQTDFITFWGPRMVNHPQVFIQFWIDKDYDEVATLEISPIPLSSKRVYLVYAPIEDDMLIQYQEQTFESFNRKGFTVIEWGGSTLPSSKITQTNKL